jgi:hypothetical protein
MIKDTWEKVNILGREHFWFSNQFFKLIIALLLPPTWDAFTDSYMGSESGIYNNDPRHVIGSQEFLGMIISKCQHCQIHTESYHSGEIIGITASIGGKQPGRGPPNKGKALLIYRTSNTYTNIVPSVLALCKLCKRAGHRIDDCSRWGENYYTFCYKAGHIKEDC